MIQQCPRYYEPNFRPATIPGRDIRRGSKGRGTEESALVEAALGIAIASLLASRFFFKGDIPREIVVVVFVVALVAAGKLLRDP